MNDLRVGISGWAYPHWKEHFYPRGVKDKDRLAFYAQHFDTVELNNTFYRLPAVALLKRWEEAVPARFLFAVKGSRLFTHYQQLRSNSDEVITFFRAIEILGDKLGPVLFQLPPNLDCDAQALSAFLQMIPTGFRLAFEFRNSTWWTSETFDLLAKHNAAFCIFDLKQKVSPLQITSDFVYVRLHGPKRPYFDRYSEDALKEWGKRVHAWRNSRRDVFFYFNNTEKASATADATALKKLVSHSEESIR